LGIASQRTFLARNTSNFPARIMSPWTTGADEIVDEIEEFVTGQRSGGGERTLATVLTEQLASGSPELSASRSRSLRRPSAVVTATCDG
jgi:hypothetical protein